MNTKHTPAMPSRGRAAIPEPRLAEYYNTLALRGDGYALRVAVDDIQAARDDRDRLHDINRKLVKALRKSAPYVRGWSGVVRRSQGHHSQNSAAVDSAYHEIRALLRDLGETT